jgi:hypothetical protein
LALKGEGKKDGKEGEERMIPKGIIRGEGEKGKRGKGRAEMPKMDRKG